MFIGAGPKWQLVQQTLQTERLPNVTLLGWQPEEALPFTLAAADIALVSLEDAFQGLAIPSKSIFAMAAGSAIVLLAGALNELYAWSTKSGWGIVVKPEQVANLDTVLFQLLSDSELLKLMQGRARSQAIEMFDRVTNFDQLCRVMHLESCFQGTSFVGSHN